MVEKIFFVVIIALIPFAFFPTDTAIGIVLFLPILVTLLWPLTIWCGFDRQLQMRFSETGGSDETELKKTTGQMVKAGAIGGAVFALIYFGSGILYPDLGLDLHSTGVGELIFPSLFCIGGGAIFLGAAFYFSAKTHWTSVYKNKVKK
jgi:hypothetical protein